MTYDFDQPISRRNIDNMKWDYYGDDVIPMWTADMDFRSAQPIIDALRERVEQGTFGYQTDSPGLREVIVARMKDRYNWDIQPDWILFTPGLSPVLTLIARAVSNIGDGILIQPPIYSPFISAVRVSERIANYAPMNQVAINDVEIKYEIDFDALEVAITPETKLFLFCNPQNPTGRVLTRDELERIADICLRHDLIICSDEIHSDFIHDDHQHIPIASLSPEIAARTVTLYAPSKTFNLAGLHLGMAISANTDLIKALDEKAEMTMSIPNALAYTAATAAYKDGQPWLDDLLVYLRANREYVIDYVREHLPGVRVTRSEGTYLSWLDCNDLNLDEQPFDLLLREAKVALINGANYGPGGSGFARLNYGCPRSQLTEALDRIRGVLARKIKV
jgi:cystathionine beta-lyase